MKHAARFLAWCALVAGLARLFALSAPEDPSPSADAAARLTVLTGAGTAEMTMAQWLPNAVAAEMPVSFGPEALKAQAVAARTYAMSARRHENADICILGGGCCVAWRDEASLRRLWGDGYEKNMAAVLAAVEETDGQYLAYEGQAIQAVFHASSLGTTEASSAIWSAQPYLVSVPTPEQDADVPDLVTTAFFTAKELAGALGVAPAGDPAEWLDEPRLDGACRVASLAVGGTVFSGQAVRSALGLRSTAFTADWDGARFRFTIAGYGHGVGMSQYGAQLYAAQGMDYRAILAHYYPGTELTSLPSR